MRFPTQALMLAVTTATLGLAACDPATAPQQPPAEPAPGPPVEAADPSGLLPLPYQAFSAQIPGGITCGFRLASGEYLMFAAAPDERDARAQAMVRTKAGDVMLTRDQAGGFQGLTEGGGFTGQGLAITVDRAPGEGRPEGVETLVWDAELAAASNGKTRATRGVWACGA